MNSGMLTLRPCRNPSVVSGRFGIGDVAESTCLLDTGDVDVAESTCGLGTGEVAVLTIHRSLFIGDVAE